MQSKIFFTDIAKAFQEEKHDTPSQLLKEFVNRNWSHWWLNHFWKNDKFGSVC